jgi:hypothetical protein
MSLLARLKERKLVQWTLAYTAGAWVLLEATGFVADQFAWPRGITRGLTLVAGIGFFVTLVLAWYHGEKGRQKVSGPELLMLTALFVVAGAALSFIGPSSETGPHRPAHLLPTTDDSRPSIAVLPLDNIGDLDESVAFTDGIHDDILTHLYKIGDLKVISRTSVMEYRDPSRNLN